VSELDLKRSFAGLYTQGKHGLIQAKKNAIRIWCEEVRIRP
jgi:hypothetical protein